MRRPNAPALPPKGTPISKWLPQGPLVIREVYGRKTAILLKGYYGIITPNQEIFCWYLAAGYSKEHSAYQAWGFVSGEHSYAAVKQNAHNRWKRMKRKFIPRIQELLDAHEKGYIDLEKDPWTVYNGLLDGYGDKQGYEKASKYRQVVPRKPVARREPRRISVREVRAMLAASGAQQLKQQQGTGEKQ